MSAFQPVRHIEPERGIRELLLSDPLTWPYPRCPGLPRSKRIVSWDRFFHGTDKLFKFLQRHRITPLRHWAVQSAKRWMLHRFASSDGLGAIFPPMIWSIVALRSLGYGEGSPEMRYCRKQLWSLVIEDEHTAHLQPCKSPVWDTALTLRALAESGLEADHPATTRGVQWLLAQEIRTRGDWSHNVNAQPGGLVLRIRQSALSRFGRYGDGGVVAAGSADHAGQPRQLAAAGFENRGRHHRPHPARRSLQSDAAWTTWPGRPTGRRIGCWPCRTATAAGGHSTKTTRPSSCATCRLPITTR